MANDMEAKMIMQEFNVNNATVDRSLNCYDDLLVQVLHNLMLKAAQVIG